MESSRPVPVDKFVDLALKQIARNRAIIVIPSIYRIWWRIYRMSPFLGIALAQMLFREMRRRLKQIESSKQ
jgi:hypothetical protein